MVSIQTNGVPGSEQPVRFYKFVALTFLIITIFLLGLIIVISSKRAQITIITKAEPVEVNTTVSIDPKSEETIVPGFVTSTLVEMSKSFSPNGNKKEEDFATGEVTIFNETTAAQPLVVKTRLLTPEGNLFRLTEGVVVPANGQVNAKVIADVKGESGNISPSTFTIPGLNETKQKVIYAKSDVAMTGGIKTIGVFAQEDLTLAEQSLLMEIKNKGAETLNNVITDKKGLFEVVQYNFEHDGEFGKEMSSFQVRAKATVVGVFYEEEKLKTYAKDMLQKHIVDNSEILQSADENPNVILSQYNLEEGTAKITVTNSGLVDLDPNSRDLQKLMFFGKTEDEVRRYVMSLDHVTGVEMNFKPVWTREVPAVSNRVEVIIRQVQ